MFASIWKGRMVGLRLVILACALLLGVIGLVNIRSVQDVGQHFFDRQLRFIAVGLAALVAVNLIHYRRLGRLSYGLFGISLLMLGFILLAKRYGLSAFVPPTRGSYRWLYLVPGVSASRVQPSELAKLTCIIALAWYLRHRKSYRRLTGLIGPFGLVLLPMALILRQPDLGTVLLFPPVLFAMLFAAGAKIRHLLVVVLAAVLVSPLFYLKMEDYQKDRIKALFKQNVDTDSYWVLGPCYQLRQSKILIATGGLTGGAAGQDGQLRYRPLPDSHNDFIFAPIAQRWGFVGSMLILVLYAVIIVGAIEIASQQTDPFGRLLAIGIAALIATQTFINIGMTMGLMPITGMTLPFVSYGGSSLLTSFLALGLLFNVARNRPYQIARKPFEFGED